MSSHNNGKVKVSATDTILESISDGVFTVDLNWRVTSFNRAAEEITGVSRKEAIGKPCAEVFRSSLCGAEFGITDRRHRPQPPARQGSQGWPRAP